MAGLVPTQTGISNESFKNMQLDAGAFFYELEVDTWTPETLASEVGTLLKTAKSEGKCFGATLGGGAFRCVPEERKIEADGVRGNFKGGTVFDGWDVALTTTVKEITEQNILNAIATGEKDANTGAIRGRNTLELGDYLKNIVWAGNLQDGKLAVIEIENALNVAGFELTFQDKGEGTYAVEYRAHNEDVETMEYAPCNIWIFGEDGVQAKTASAFNQRMATADTKETTKK